jgi:hypothetical protein
MIVKRRALADRAYWNANQAVARLLNEMATYNKTLLGDHVMKRANSLRGFIVIAEMEKAEAAGINGLVAWALRPACRVGGEYGASPKGDPWRAIMVGLELAPNRTAGTTAARIAISQDGYALSIAIDPSRH